MATLVFFHAHPDDEAIATGGVMIQAATAGHRVVLVTATDGAVGEDPDGVVPEGSTLADVRAAETQDAAEVLGAARLEFLGYRDSGMEGEPTNDDPECFWQADVEDAAQRLAVILREEEPDLLTVYDDHGGYGHPDHVQVHRVGVRAAELAGVGLVYESTMNRDHMRALADVAIDGVEDDDEMRAQREEMRETEVGTPESGITHAIDVRDVLATKRAAMAAHRSQIGEDSWFLKMDDTAFAMGFGTEWFIRRGTDRVGPPWATDILAELGDVAPAPRPSSAERWSDEVELGREGS